MTFKPENPPGSKKPAGVSEQYPEGMRKKPAGEAKKPAGEVKKPAGEVRKKPSKGGSPKISEEVKKLATELKKPSTPVSSRQVNMRDLDLSDPKTQKWMKESGGKIVKSASGQRYWQVPSPKGQAVKASAGSVAKVVGGRLAGAAGKVLAGPFGMVLAGVEAAGIALDLGLGGTSGKVGKAAALGGEEGAYNAWRADTLEKTGETMPSYEEYLAKQSRLSSQRDASIDKLWDEDDQGNLTRIAE